MSRCVSGRIATSRPPPFTKVMTSGLAELVSGDLRAGRRAGRRRASPALRSASWRVLKLLMPSARRISGSSSLVERVRSTASCQDDEDAAGTALALTPTVTAANAAAITATALHTPRIDNIVSRRKCRILATRRLDEFPARPSPEQGLCPREQTASDDGPQYNLPENSADSRGFGPDRCLLLVQTLILKYGAVGLPPAPGASR